MVEQLPASYEIHRPLLLGHAPGLWNEGESFEDEVDRLALWFGERAAPQAVLAGYSLGGRIAVALLARHPRLFRSAVLIGAHPGIADEAARRQRVEDDEILARRLEESGIEDFVKLWEGLPLFASQRQLPAAVRERQRSSRLRHDAAGLAAALRALGAGSMPDYWPALDRLEMPIRLLAGAEDDKFCKLAHAMAERLPNATVEVVPAAGHNLLLEAPAAVAAAIAGVAGSMPRGIEP